MNIRLAKIMVNNTSFIFKIMLDNCRAVVSCCCETVFKTFSNSVTDFKHSIKDIEKQRCSYEEIHSSQVNGAQASIKILFIFHGDFA